MVLNLALATDPAWARRAIEHIDEILLEQAHLEKKAAAAAVNFLFRYPDRPSLQVPLSALAREELEHFERVLGELERRGIPFVPQQASPYAARLLEVARADEPHRLMDRMLRRSLIEARSFERMKLLGEALVDRDPPLAELYLDLIASEARHHGTYVRLASDLFGADVVAARLVEVAAHEASVQRALPASPRLHT